jgi:hypothetical protein
MPSEELRAESLQSFEAIVSELGREWDPGNVSLWFRGQGNSEWSLVPKFHRMIPVESDLFKLFQGDESEMVWIHRDMLGRQPKQVERLYEDFAVMKKDRYGCPRTFNTLTPGWYLNESRRPNVRCDDQYEFFALRDIKEGEELTVDYKTYSESVRVGSGGNRDASRKAKR